MGVLLLMLIGCMELTGVGVAMDSVALMWAGGVLLVPVTVGGLVYINISKHFKRK